MKEKIDWNTFSAVEIRVGTILKAEEFPEARKPAIKLTIDFGDFGIKKSSAQITALYKPEDLVGRQILAVTNFPAKQIGHFMSECLVLGAVCEKEGIVLIQPDRLIANGTEIA
jgi:tRNA-binding protein